MLALVWRSNQGESSLKRMISVRLGISVCVALSPLLVACGGGDDDDDSSATGNCGTAANPIILELQDVAPAAGSSVPNDAIVHRYTVVGVSATFDPDLQVPSTHTAGQPMPSPFIIQPTVVGDGMVTYEFEPISWTTAPSHVTIQDTSVYQTSDGCIYAFPQPIFDYDVVAP